MTVNDDGDVPRRRRFDKETKSSSGELQIVPGHSDALLCQKKYHGPTAPKKKPKSNAERQIQNRCDMNIRMQRRFDSILPGSTVVMIRSANKRNVFPPEESGFQPIL